MNKLKLFALFAAMIFATSMWADDPVVEGPWTQIAMKSHACSRTGVASSIMFDTLNNQKWSASTIKFWQDQDGVGYTINGTSDNYSMMAIFSTYQHAVVLPPYSSVKLEWKYQLRSKSTKHHSATCLYALQGMENDITHLAVDFSNHHDSQAGAEYLLDYYVNQAQDGKTKKASEKTQIFECDNLAGETPLHPTWYLMLTHVTGSGDPKDGLKEWGSFKSVSFNTTYTYRTIITFDANGGTGMMEDQIIDGSGKLSPNAFANGDLIFAGWATEKDGPVVCLNQAAVTVTESNKGPQVLYAVWNDSDQGLKEGPWTQLERATETCANSDNQSIYFNRMDNTQWVGTIDDVNDDKGTGYSFQGASQTSTRFGIFSTYKAEANVPSYTSMNLTWHFSLGSKSNGHHSSVCLYALPDSYDNIKNLYVDFSNSFDETKASQAGTNLLAWFTNTEQQGTQCSTSEQTATLMFDNRDESVEQTKKWFMLMTYTMQSAGGKSGLDENGVFKNISADTTWIYRKTITFHPRGGEGTMNNQNIDNRGYLPPNMFIRNGFAFAGWATDTLSHVVAYADGDEITVDANNKGLDTLYAVWTPSDVPVSPVEQGSWKQVEWRSATRAKSGTPTSITFNQADNTKWDGTITGMCNNDGTGYNFVGTSPISKMMGIFSTYESKQLIPSYSRMALTWKYKLYSKSTKHHSAVCLYAVPDAYDSIANLAVDFSDHLDTQAGAEHRLAYFTNTNTDGQVRNSGEQTSTLIFDNLASKDSLIQSYYLLLSYVIGSSASETQGLDESGYFQHVNVTSAWTYRKIITFDSNDGEEGEMADQIIDGSGNLTANAFTREGYTFAGWATDPIGDVVYADGASITVDADGKGLDTLYAKWNLEGETPPTPQVQGPWTQVAWNTMACANNINPSMAYSRMDSTKWTGSITPLLDNDGVGFIYEGSSPENGKMGIFSIYKAEENLQSYTSKTMTWKYQLRSKSTKHHSTTCLYGPTNSYDEIANTAVDFTNHYTSASGALYLMKRFANSEEDGKTRKGSEATTVLTLDNLDGNAQQTKACYIMLTHVVASADGRSGLKEWGSFRSVSLKTSYTYRKIITFNANGGDGEMAEQIIDNSGNLSANLFHRDGYVFAGWATSSGGSKAFDDKASITATAGDKGPVTLYALWTAGSAPSPVVEGPWTQLEYKTMACDKSTNPSITYAAMNSTKWDGNITGWENENGIGYTFAGSSSKNSKMGIFSTYIKQVEVPAYSRISMTWVYRLRSVSTKHHSYTCLYGRTGAYGDIVNLAVDFSNHYDTKTGSAYLWAQLGNTDEDGYYKSSGVVQKTIDFDNHEGSIAQTKAWYLLMTHVMASSDARSSLNEWGSFIHLQVEYDTCYYKYITLYPNGGMGQMKQPVIENSGNLPANTYTRAGYTFAGWATTADGEVVYENQAPITATKTDNGPVTLYAKWTPVNYSISYQLNGGTAENPENYTPTAGITLANPTKTDSTFLGWTGSNGAIPQTGVAIAKGSAGNKTFTAHWISNAVAGTITKINEIGEVSYTEASKAKIDAARAAYNALSEEDQALVTNIGLLTAAEDAYITAKENVEGNTTLSFKQGDTPLGSQKINLVYPDAPVIAGYTFRYWQTIAEDVTAGTIRLKAFYTKDEPTDLEDVNAKANASKFIKDGNLYILKEEFIYTINGQRVNF